MRIVHVIENLSRGGAEYALVNLLPVLVAKGYKCEVVALRPPYDLADELEPYGIRVHRLDLSHRWNVYQGVVRLFALCRRCRYDIVHAHLFFGLLYTALTKPLVPRPRRVVTFHNLGFDSYPANTLRRRLLKRVHGWLARAVDARIAVSQAVAAHYEEHLSLPGIEIIPNAFPIERLSSREIAEDRTMWPEFGFSQDDFVLLLAGRFVPEKGHLIFLQALDVLRERGLEPKALLIGDGPTRAMVAAAIKTQGMARQVAIHPAVPRARLLGIIRAADVVVMASTQEGFPLIPGEAMLLERPVVATAVGGLPELIIHGESGLLVPAGNPTALADTIARLIEDRELRDRLGRAGRTRVERYFSTDALALRVDDLYLGLGTERLPSWKAAKRNRRDSAPPIPDVEPRCGPVQTRGRPQ